MLLLALILVAGCTAPPPAEPISRLQGDPDEASPEGNATEYEVPLELPGGEDDSIRVRLASHSIKNGTVRLVLDVLNKEADARYVFGYGYLNTTAGSMYFGMSGEVRAGEERRFTNETYDNDSVATASWQMIDLFYQMDAGGEYWSDRSLALDLRGLGLPKNVS